MTAKSTKWCVLKDPSCRLITTFLLYSCRKLLNHDTIFAQTFIFNFSFQWFGQCYGCSFSYCELVIFCFPSMNSQLWKKQSSKLSKKDDMPLFKATIVCVAKTDQDMLCFINMKFSLPVNLYVNRIEVHLQSVSRCFP